MGRAASHRAGVGAKWRKREERHYERRFKNDVKQSRETRRKPAVKRILVPKRGKAKLKPVGLKSEQKTLLSSDRLTLKPSDKRKVEKIIWPQIRVPAENNREAAEYMKKIVASSKEICSKRGGACASATEASSTQESLDLGTNLTSEVRSNHASFSSYSDAGKLPNVRAWLHTAKRQDSEDDKLLCSTPQKPRPSLSPNRKNMRSIATSPIHISDDSSASEDEPIEIIQKERGLTKKAFASFFARLKMHHSASVTLAEPFKHGSWTMEGTRRMSDVQRELFEMLSAPSNSGTPHSSKSTGTSSSRSSVYCTATDSVETFTLQQSQNGAGPSHPPKVGCDVRKKTLEQNHDWWFERHVGSEKNSKADTSVSTTLSGHINVPNFMERKEPEVLTRRGPPRLSSLFHGCDWFDEMLTTDRASDSSENRSRFGASGSFRRRPVEKNRPSLENRAMYGGAEWFDETLSCVDDCHMVSSEEDLESEQFENTDFITIRKPSPLRRQATPPDFLFSKPVRF